MKGTYPPTKIGKLPIKQSEVLLQQHYNELVSKLILRRQEELIEKMMQEGTLIPSTGSLIPYIQSKPCK